LKSATKDGRFFIFAITDDRMNKICVSCGARHVPACIPVLLFRRNEKEFLETLPISPRNMHEMQANVTVRRSKFASLHAICR
jgi:hypothetical protein